MTENNETVKERGEAPSLLFTILPRRGLLGNWASGTTDYQNKAPILHQAFLGFPGGLELLAALKRRQSKSWGYIPAI
jgi:hypothetical protein